jgi:hypothetical protein
MSGRIERAGECKMTMKWTVFVSLLILLGNMGLVFGDPIPVPTFNVQGAKTVSEGAYFWIEIRNIGHESTEIYVFLEPPFNCNLSVHAVYINDGYVNRTECVINEREICIRNFGVGDTAEILLSAPYLVNLSDPTTFVPRIMDFPLTFKRGYEETEFRMTVLGAGVLPHYYDLDAENDELLALNSDLNQTVTNMQYEAETLSDENSELNQTITSMQKDAQIERNSAFLIEMSLSGMVIAMVAILVYYVRRKK